MSNPMACTSALTSRLEVTYYTYRNSRLCYQLKQLMSYQTGLAVAIAYNTSITPEGVDIGFMRAREVNTYVYIRTS